MEYDDNFSLLAWNRHGMDIFVRNLTGKHQNPNVNSACWFSWLNVFWSVYVIRINSFSCMTLNSLFHDCQHKLTEDFMSPDIERQPWPGD